MMTSTIYDKTTVAIIFYCRFSRYRPTSELSKLFYFIFFQLLLQRCGEIHRNFLGIPLWAVAASHAELMGPQVCISKSFLNMTLVSDNAIIVCCYDELMHCCYRLKNRERKTDIVYAISINIYIIL